ncbi:MAG: DUF2971 domain-containing protein [Bacteroidota bacterium]
MRKYADNNKGVCLVINENKLIERNKSALAKIFYKIESVDYKPYLPFLGELENISPKDFFMQYYHQVFFEKHSDWESENERRLFCIDPPEFLSIDQCLEFIVLGGKFSEANYDDLARYLSTNNMNHKQILTPHEFAFQVNSFGHCSARDASFRIIEKIKDKKYIAWLNRNGYHIQL